MNPEIFTTSAQELINKSILIAQENKNPTVQPLHTLAAGINNEFCISFLNVLNVKIDELHTLVNLELGKLPVVEGSQLSSDYALENFLKDCQKEAELLGDTYVSLEHFLIEWCETSYLPAAITQFFKRSGVTRQAILSHMQTIRKGKTVKEKNAEKQYQILEKYCQNVTQNARDGRLDPVIGRHEEIRRVIQILSRRTKNNPVLIGEPGVGKTAIVEGIAQRIINNDVPESLKNNIIYALDLGLLIAGAKYQGGDTGMDLHPRGVGKEEGGALEQRNVLDMIGGPLPAAEGCQQRLGLGCRGLHPHQLHPAAGKVIVLDIHQQQALFHSDLSTAPGGTGGRAAGSRDLPPGFLNFPAPRTAPAGRRWEPAAPAALPPGGSGSSAIPATRP